MVVDVQAVLDKIGIDYSESGDRFMVCCPFHHDRNPSCGIWRDSGYFRCFSGSCGKEGSLVDLVAHVEGVSHRDALNLVSGSSSIANLEESVIRMLDTVEVPLQYFSFASFKKTYPAILPDTRAWDYLMGRGITGESISRFNIRWGGVSGKYRHRVILPVFTPEGKLLAYAGRAIYADMVPKIRNNRSPHRTLFGLKELLEVVPNPRNLVVVEGAFDAIYLQQFGVPAVANQGTMPMSPEKVRQIRRYSKRGVVLSFDGDDAGVSAVYGKGDREGHCDVLSKHVPVHVVELPDGADPNSLSEKDVIRLYADWRV